MKILNISTINYIECMLLSVEAEICQDHQDIASCRYYCDTLTANIHFESDSDFSIIFPKSILSNFHHPKILEIFLQSE